MRTLERCDGVGVASGWRVVHTVGMRHTPDFPLIHGALIARGIPCHLTSDGSGWVGVTIGYAAGRTIGCSWADGAYELTFPCGMVRMTMRTTAPAASVADEMAWQYNCLTKMEGA